MDIRGEYQELQTSFNNFYETYEQLVLDLYQGSEASLDSGQKRLGTFDVRRQQMKNNTFTVVVIGEIKHGKSTLLNALLHKPAFPKDISEATATISYMRHNNTAEQPEWHDKAVVFFREGLQRPPIVVEQTELKDYTTCLGNKLNVAEDVEKVVVYTDSPFVEDGVTVVDTPGTNTTFEQHQNITETQIEKSDAAIFLFKAGMSGKKSDFEFLADTSSKINKFFFVINRIDEIGGMKNADKVKNDILKKMHSLPALSNLDTSRFFPTSGLLALLSRYGFLENEKYDEDEWRQADSPDFRQSLLAQSGVPEFEEALLAYLFKGERIAEMFRSQLKYLASCISEDQTMLSNRRQALEGNMDLAELDNRRKDLQLEKDRQQGKIDAAATALNEKLSQSLHDFMDEAQTKMQNRLDDFAESLSEYTDYYAMESDWNELSMKPAKIAQRTRMELQYRLQDVAKAVFKAQETKLRGELNNSLKNMGFMELPDISSSFGTVVMKKDMNLGQVNQEVMELQSKLKSCEEMLANATEVSENYQSLKDKREALESELKREQERAERRLERMGNRPAPQTIIIPAHTEYEDRGGFFGSIAQIFIGQKEVNYPAKTKIDTTAQDCYDREKQKLEEWQEKKETELNQKIASLDQSFSQARKAEMKRLNDEKIRQACEQKLQEAKQRKQLAEEQEKKKVINQNIKLLRDTLSQAFDNLKEILQSSVDKCEEWADEYIGRINAEVNDFMNTRGKELADLEAKISMKKEEKEKALIEVENLTVKLDELSQQWQALSEQTNSSFN